MPVLNHLTFSLVQAPQLYMHKREKDLLKLCDASLPIYV